MHKEHQFYKVLYSFSEQVLVYSYAVQNLTNVPLEITLDLSNSEQMLCSCGSYYRVNCNDESQIMTKIIMPG